MKRAGLGILAAWLMALGAGASACSSSPSKTCRGASCIDAGGEEEDAGCTGLSCGDQTPDASLDAREPDADESTDGATSDADPAACRQCVSGNCAKPLQACGSDTACAAIAQCDTACTDATCTKDCEKANPDGAAGYDDFLGCVAAFCYDACGSSAPGILGR